MKIHYLTLAMLGVSALCLPSCSNDNTLNNIDEDGPTISVSVGIAGGGPVASRAMGEADDEDELASESTINNVLFLIYDKPLNSGDPGTIVKTAYVKKTGEDNKLVAITNTSPHEVVYYPYSNALNTTSVGKVNTKNEYRTEFKAADLEPGKRYYAIALANFGEDFEDMRGKSLDYLRNYIYKGPLYTIGSNIMGNSDFRMSAINEVSFLYEKQETFNIKDIFLVQRLACRLDLMFGNNSGTYGGLNNKNTETNEYTSDFFLDMTENQDYGGSAVFPVYEYHDGVATRSTTSLFFLTEVEMLNTRKQTDTGLYLLERASATATGAPTYFGNEAWTDYNENTGKYEYASYYVQSPTNAVYNEPISLLTPYGYSTIKDLIFGGNINTTHSVVGYFTENTNDANHQTAIRISGWTNASTSEMFAAPSRATRDAQPTRPSYLNDTYKFVRAEIPIRHNIRPEVPTHNSYPLEYAMVRNTIYRVFIRVYAVENKIYFRYYYYDNPNNKEDLSLDTNNYSVGTGFNSQISESLPGTVTD